MSDALKDGKEPADVKAIRQSFDAIYNGPDELYHEYTLQKTAATLSIPLDAYRKLYDLRHTQAFPPYPRPAKWRQMPGTWLKWYRSLPKGKRGQLFDSYFRKWGFKVLQGGTLLTLLGAGAHYLATIPQREKQARDALKQAHYQAWQIVNMATNQHSSGGRIEALEDLAKDKVLLNNLDAPEANLIGIDLHGANIVQSNLYQAILGGAKLQGATLNLSNLEGAYFGVADLQKTYLAGANLRRASFLSADLRGAYLRASHLEAASFPNTNLEGAALQETTGLQRDALMTAHLCHTALPDGLKDLSDRDCGKPWSALPQRR